MSSNINLEKMLAEEGYKITKNRRDILEVLVNNSDSWLTAQEIFEKVAAVNKKINFSTVYRNLDMLSGIGMLCRVDKGQGVMYYILNYQSDHHHHLICKACGKTRKVDFCPLQEMKVKEIEEMEGFTIENHSFEIYGYCDKCKNNIDNS